MKDKKVMLIAGVGAVVLLGVLGYAFVGSSGNDADPSRPYSADSGDASSPDDTAADSPTRGAVANQAGSSSSRLDAADSSETEEGEEEAAIQKKKKKNRKGRKGYSSQSEAGEEQEETKDRPKKTIRSKKKIPLGGG
ncbi:MAG: hypothetical protein IID34_16975 [Planctomycetes bacterium]|nr:hypothetical protein [Planctomycetota bacterium]